MPKRAVRILIAAVLTGLLGAAGSAQQSHDSAKSQTVQAPPPPAPVHTSATTVSATAKYAPVTRDVCDKHPNLKQCS